MAEPSFSSRLQKPWKVPQTDGENTLWTFTALREKSEKVAGIV